VKLDGVLAIRRSWCLPGEPVLLCAASGGAATRYDVAGLDWWGKPERGAVGKVAGALGSAAFGVVDAAFAGSGPEDNGADAPNVVAWGPSPDTIATRLCLPSPARTWLVLTPHRLAYVTVVEDEPDPRSEPDKSLLDKVSGFARAARDAFGSTSPHPPHQPIATTDMTTVAEIPRQHVTGIAVAERKLPRQYQTRQSHVLRVSMVDGSGLDVLTAGQEGAQRLHAMTNGQR
jgi:hypothetical protein